MLNPEQTVYQIVAEPVSGRTRALNDGKVLADSRGARVLHETRLPSCVYLPPADVETSLLRRNQHRTFCPFKGTASHYDLVLPDKVVANAAWSYEQPLPEAASIAGYISFYPDAVEHWEYEDDLPATPDYGHASGPLVDWLLREAWQCRTPEDLTRELGERLVADGIPVWRLSVGIWTLHPLLLGMRYIWVRDQSEVTVNTMPHSALNHPSYLNSPVRHVSEGRGGVRQRLDADVFEFDFPVMEELRQQGGTDYVAMPLPFSDGQIHTLTLTSDHAAGFSTADLGRVFEATAVLSRFYEVLAAQLNTETLLDTYLGPRTSSLVRSGQVKRGHGQQIRAAILFCDLRESTRLSDELDRDDYLDLLNGFFEGVTQPVVAHGGEVLKFIGDAVLAIFPVDQDEGESCRRAQAAAREIVDNIAEVGRARGRDDVRCAIGVHVGDVTYGNVGSPTRLDFTVTGSATGRAERLCELAKAIDKPLVMSDRVAKFNADAVASLGHFPLRHVHGQHEVFAPSD